MRNTEADDPLMPKTEHHVVTRLPMLRRVYNAIFGRTRTVEHALPAMNTSIGNIIRDARVIEAGLGHIGEAYFDSQELSDEFAHLVTFAINLPTTIEGDGGFWGYALNLVEAGAFKEGVEYCSIERIEDFITVLNEVLAMKREIKAQEKH